MELKQEKENIIMYVKKISGKKYFDLYELLKKTIEERRVFAQEIKEDLKILMIIVNLLCGI